jgi:hypothetical protein
MSTPPGPASDGSADLERQARTARWLLPAMAAGVVALLLARRAGMGGPLLEHPLLPLWASFVLTYVGCTALSLMPAPLGQRLDELLDRHLQSWGSGLYGVISLAVFLRLELASALESWGNVSGMDRLWRNLLWDWLVGFSMESMRNAISAVTWPLPVLREHRWQGLLAFMLACSVVFALGRRLLPERHRRLDTDAEDTP